MAVKKSPKVEIPKYDPPTQTLRQNGTRTVCFPENWQSEKGTPVTGSSKASKRIDISKWNIKPFTAT
jgi:hypothetical protein